MAELCDLNKTLECLQAGKNLTSKNGMVMSLIQNS